MAKHPHTIGLLLVLSLTVAVFSSSDSVADTVIVMGEDIFIFHSSRVVIFLNSHNKRVC